MDPRSGHSRIDYVILPFQNHIGEFKVPTQIKYTTGTSDISTTSTKRLKASKTNDPQLPKVAPWDTHLIAEQFGQSVSFEC